MELLCVIFYIDPIHNWWSLLICLRLLIYRILTHRVSTLMGSENFIDKAFLFFLLIYEVKVLSNLKIPNFKPDSILQILEYKSLSFSVIILRIK